MVLYVKEKNFIELPKMINNKLFGKEINCAGGKDDTLKFICEKIVWTLYL